MNLKPLLVEPETPEDYLKNCYEIAENRGITKPERLEPWKAQNPRCLFKRWKEMVRVQVRKE